MLSEVTVYQRVAYGSPDKEVIRDYEWQDTSIRDLGCGAGSIACPACGVGEDYNDTNPYNRLSGCIECKNSGRVLVCL